MSEFILLVKQGIQKACDDFLCELNQQEQEIEAEIAALVNRKVDLTRKREIFVSLLEKSRLELQQMASLQPDPPQHIQQSPSAQPLSSLLRNRPLPSKSEPAKPPTTLSAAPDTEGQTSETRVVDHKPHIPTEERYKAVLGKIAEQVANDATSSSAVDLSTLASNPLSDLEPQSRFAEFPKVRGDTYLVYRLTPDDRGDLEKIPRYNEYFTQPLMLSRESPLHPAIYVLDVVVFLKTFFDEIRHIESCLKYQEANWKTIQAKILMNKSYQVLVQLIDEILNAYSQTLQASPENSGSVRPIRVRVRNTKAIEQEVEIAQLSQKGKQLFLDKAEVTFVGYPQQDIQIIFPVSTLEVMNPHILKHIRDELTQNRHEQSIAYWRACEIRIQELEGHYESSLLEQLRTWFT